VKVFIAGALFGAIVTSVIWWVAHRGQAKALGDVKEFMKDANREIKEEIEKIKDKVG